MLACWWRGEMRTLMITTIASECEGESEREKRERENEQLCINIVLLARSLPHTAK